MATPFPKSPLRKSPSSKSPSPALSPRVSPSMPQPSLKSALQRPAPPPVYRPAMQAKQSPAKQGPPPVFRPVVQAKMVPPPVFRPPVVQRAAAPTVYLPQAQPAPPAVQPRVTATRPLLAAVSPLPSYPAVASRVAGTPISPAAPHYHAGHLPAPLLLGQAFIQARRTSNVIQCIGQTSTAWEMGQNVIRNLQKLVANAPPVQMVGAYPQFQDDLAQMLAHPSEWGEKKRHMEGVNVGAITVAMDNDVEVFAYSFNSLGPKQRAYAQRTIGLLPEEFHEGVLPIDTRSKDITEHAEMQLAGSGKVETGTYIGISKECCLCCAAALIVQGKYKFGGCHGEAFNNWLIPSFITSNAESFAKFLGSEAWKYYEKLKEGRGYLPLSMAEEATYKGEFIEFLQTGWAALQRSL